MASELVSCPECQRKLRVPSELIGKLVKCPTCGHTFTADPVAQAPTSAPEAVEEKKAPRTSKVGRDDKDDEDDDRPSRRRSRSSREDDDEDDDDRPRRRSRYSRDDDDEDDDDDRPRRSRRDYAPHRGGAILAIGILSFFFFSIVLGPIAWIMGNNDLAEMRAGRMDPTGEGSTQAGRICGMISTILSVAVILIFCIFCGCAGVGGGMQGGRR
jgi:predicted Zn finger-like uncharacterized protein